ncbi:hypothetical protein [Streptomyces chartreusis]|uniref:hypothetical protein n=1 Tax=Streptomyces chartreusis TaxID=1969 RepID=UPI0035E1CE0B
MSKHGSCYFSRCPNGAVASWTTSNGTYTLLCKDHLDCWFDNADDDEALEPTAWAWLAPPAPAPADITAWARDPRNHQALAEVLRREARIDPRWLRSFLAREWRRGALLAYS